MQTDPIQEWRRLTDHYRAMSDEQIEELAADFADLTAAAQQILRGEMRSRSLGDPQAPPEASKNAGRSPKQTANHAASRLFRPQSVFASYPQEIADVPPDAGDSEPKDGHPREYTWKTVLCECEQREQAWQLSEALDRAGIDSWIEGPAAGGNWELRYHRVLVAADQLEPARAIASGPIPQDIVDASREPTPEFVPPKCPGCGAADPSLEGVDAVNTWRCETCGRQWTDPDKKTGGQPDGGLP